MVGWFNLFKPLIKGNERSISIQNNIRNNQYQSSFKLINKLLLFKNRTHFMVSHLRWVLHTTDFVKNFNLEVRIRNKEAMQLGKLE